MPQSVPECKEKINDMNNMWQFPFCWGALDDCHIPKVSTWGRLYEARIAYSADKSWKHNSVIQALNNQTLILSAE